VTLEEALLQFWKRAWPPLRRRIDSLFERAADVVRPDPPLYMQTLDGDTVTGIVVLERGQAVAFLGTRHPRAARTSGHHQYPNDPFREDDPLWDRHGRPYTGG
jgi:hypothetical protein